jgi:hypothetical protein
VLYWENPSRRYGIMNLTIALIDNDHVVRAKTDLSEKGQDEPFRKFLRQIKEELIPGQTAYLEIEDSITDPITFEISRFE